VAVALNKEGDEPVEVQGDLLGHLLGANADRRQREVPRRPSGEGLQDVPRQTAGDRPHLSGSETREIGERLGRLGTTHKA
jgi:hypothetical protein